ncbi:MAG: BRCT domain-containing protein [Pseudomonadales bacterium]|nr:BRCT domain-containing protein [Pseudomonadales bacterium]MBO6563978.1 BRCT domain-containing protein [Pseudomonadales bacterium]MBO6594727.1 BRCT domain-containing protein [Pseudomonadales bacterium]MBO6658989.1 BRCT domain-containing protein [Pseudomonadales bacterium]MBO6701233.1 BRCT domain-containing protein [Pseudomonadales bacterium]
MSKSARSKNASRIQDRLIDELIGICRGIIADGVIEESEAIFLGQWIENHRELAEKWPANVVYARVTEMLMDGVLSDEEQNDLLTTLRDLTGEGSPLQEPNQATSLPLTKPEPEVDFSGKEFCLTGKFVFGSVEDCEETIVEVGGQVVESPETGTDYLVIGEFCSPDWVHTTFGRAIERAVELQQGGAAIKIISERRWVDALAGN